MNDIKYINLDQPWWNQNAKEALSFYDCVYFCSGDISTNLLWMMETMYFNKDMIENLQLKTIYDLVNDNEWVYEKFFEYVEAAKKDDGDGVVSLSDTFGASAQVTFGFMMTMGSGEMLTQKKLMLI